MDYDHEVLRWVDKHTTPVEIKWAIHMANASINTLTAPFGIIDDYELAVWRARLPLLRTKALLLGLPNKD